MENGPESNDPEAGGTALSYCADIVRRQDKDRFLTALFAPEPARSRLMALYAFNLEIARTRENVSEPMIGEIRLQWWRDALDAIYKGVPPEHEVAQALANAIGDTNAPRDPFDRLIDARSFDLYDEPMSSMDDLRTYVEGTSSTLMEAASVMIAGKPDPMVSEVAKHAGIAWGIVGLVRALPIHSERGQQFVPLDLVTTHGVTWNQIASGQKFDSVQPALVRMCHDATQSFKSAKTAARGMPRSLLPALMPAALTNLYLRKLRQRDFNPFAENLDVPVFRKQLVLIKHALTGRL